MVLFSASFFLWYGKLFRRACENGKIVFSYKLSFSYYFVVLLKLKQVNETFSEIMFAILHNCNFFSVVFSA